jgi:hypothetical protein
VNAVAWRSPTDLTGEATLHVAAGDLVRTGENRHPAYHIIAVSKDRAWIRDTQHGTDHVVPIDHFRKI